MLVVLNIVGLLTKYWKIYKLIKQHLFITCYSRMFNDLQRNNNELFVLQFVLFYESLKYDI